MLIISSVLCGINPRCIDRPLGVLTGGSASGLVEWSGCCGYSPSNWSRLVSRC